MKSISLLAFCCTIGVLVSLSCDFKPLSPPAEPSDSWEMPVLGFTASYNGANNRVLLQWDKPAYQFDYYRVFRTSHTNLDGTIDSSSLVSSEARLRINKDSVSFSDIPDLEHTVYYYAIAAVRIDNGTHVRGALSPLDTCFVGKKVSFNINNNALFVETNHCSLYVDDPANEVDSVRFTQYRRLVDNTNFKTYAPLFDTADARNPQRVYTSVNPYYEWVFDRGTGEKFVYAEITYKPTAAVVRRDTIMDIIRTKPHQITLSLRNDIDSLRETVARIGSEQVISVVILYQPLVKYSIRIFGDRSLNKQFSYKLSCVDSTSRFTTTAIEYSGTIETKTIVDSFRTIPNSDLFDEGVEYSFTFSGENVESLSELRLIKKDLSTKKDLPPVTINGTPAALAQRFLALKSTQRVNGRKEFRMSFSFTDKYFEDTIKAYLGYEGEKEVQKTTFDVYPPVVRFRAVNNPDHINNGSVIDRAFNVALEPDPLQRSPSVLDTGGLANITSVQLVIAKRPPDWNRTWSFDSLASSTRYQVIPFRIPAPKPVLYNVRWDNIDPMSWPSGMYVMGVLVEDEFGNKGFALPEVETEATSNPWVVEVRSPK